MQVDRLAVYEWCVALQPAHTIRSLQPAGPREQERTLACGLCMGLEQLACRGGALAQIQTQKHTPTHIHIHTNAPCAHLLWEFILLPATNTGTGMAATAQQCTCATAAQCPPPLAPAWWYTGCHSMSSMGTGHLGFGLCCLRAGSVTGCGTHAMGNKVWRGVPGWAWVGLRQRKQQQQKPCALQGCVRLLHSPRSHTTVYANTPSCRNPDAAHSPPAPTHAQRVRMPAARAGPLHSPSSLPHLAAHSFSSGGTCAPTPAALHP